MSQENVEIVQRSLDAFNRRDRTAWLALCDPEYQAVPTADWPETDPISGPEAAWDVYVEADEQWEASPYEVVKLIDAENGQVAAHLVREMRGKASGAGVTYDYWVVSTVRNGKVRRADFYEDEPQALEAVGLSDQAMSQENVEIVRPIYAAWERGDFTSAEWAHPDIELVVADSFAAGSVRGLAEMAASWQDWLSSWEEYRVEVDEYRELDDERVLVLMLHCGRGKTSGLDVGQTGTKSAGANLLHVRDGRVTRLVLYWDRERALADLGISE